MSGPPHSFKISDTVPEPNRIVRGGKYVDAVRHIIASPSDHVSFPFGGKTGTTAPRLRVGFGNAARSLGVKVTTRTADGRVYATLVVPARKKK